MNRENNIERKTQLLETKKESGKFRNKIIKCEQWDGGGNETHPLKVNYVGDTKHCGQTGQTKYREENHTTWRPGLNDRAKRKNKVSIIITHNDDLVRMIIKEKVGGILYELYWQLTQFFVFTRINLTPAIVILPAQPSPPTRVLASYKYIFCYFLLWMSALPMNLEFLKLTVFWKT